LTWESSRSGGLGGAFRTPPLFRLVILFPEPEEVLLGIAADGEIAPARHGHLRRDDGTAERFDLLHTAIDRINPDELA
jgi:hypothetical protein